MRVDRVRYGWFMSTTDEQEVVFPPTGVVLVTGQNGSGKSTLVEAVSFAGWGKTLRGTDPKRAREAGLVSMDTAVGLNVDRRWGDGGRGELSVSLAGEPEWVFENNTKAQEHVTGVLGEWDTWRRSCAFSATDDLSFATATDAERKRLLEAILDLGRMDRALDRCRADAKAAAGDLTRAQRATQDASISLSAARGSLAQLEAMAAAMAPEGVVGEMTAQLAELEVASAAAWADLDAANRALTAASVAHASSEAEAFAARSLVDAMRKHTSCPTCAQDWPDAEARAARLREAEVALAAAEAAVVPRPTRDAVVAAQDAYALAKSARDGQAVAVRQLQAAQAAHARALQEVEQRRADAAALGDALEVASAAERGALVSVAHFREVDNVLGTRGARAHMLHDALGTLEQCANRWLDLVARTDAPLSLRLSPYTEKKSGGTSDAIGLEVTGAGGGRGYRAASGGERRRIDCALMFALAEVAQMSANRVAPTMFLDEVFDALDGDGIEAVADALYHLSQDRCVVVVSHSDQLAAHLSPVMRLRAEGGRLVSSR